MLFKYVNFKLFRSILIVSLILSSSACLRRQTNKLDGAPVGYVSESTCLRLISGQEVIKSNEMKKVSSSCAETCECRCSSLSPAVYSNSKNDNSKADSNKVKTAKSTVVTKTRPVVAAKSVKPIEEDSARASLKVKSEPVAIKSSENKSSEKAKNMKPSAQTTSTLSNRAGNQNVREVQEALNAKGAKLDVDGVMGERTVRLIKAFQTMNDLPVTGKADEATAKALGIEVR